MANKSYTYDVHWSWRDQGNRVVEGVERVKATTVQRAISKAVKELNVDPENPGDAEGRGGSYLDKDHPEFIKAADIFVIACQNVTRGWTGAQL